MDLIQKYFDNLSPTQLSQFAMLDELYREWNSRINVISRRDIEELYLRHVLHSLAIAKSGEIHPGESVLDVGSGGGFPGIPLAILMPNVEFTLCDSIGKKVKVITEIASALGLNNVKPIQSRAEQLPERYDWVISRAVTRLSLFLELMWDKAEHGVICLKGGDLTEEIAETNRKAKLYDISQWFEEEFFETKKVLLIKRRV